MKPGTLRCKHLLLEHVARRTLSPGPTWFGHCRLLLVPPHEGATDRDLVLANLERLGSDAVRCPYWADASFARCPAVAPPDDDHG